MFEWFESLPVGLRVVISVGFVTALTIWGAREKVHTGEAKTFVGGLGIELAALVFCSASIVLVAMTLFPPEDASNQLMVQYFSAGALCLMIALICARAAGQIDGKFNRATWSALLLGVVALYLFYGGWRHS